VRCTNEGGEAWCVEDGNGWADANNGDYCVSWPDTDPYTEWCPEGCTCKHYQPQFAWTCFNGCIQSICTEDEPDPPEPTCADLTLSISNPTCSETSQNQLIFSITGSFSDHNFSNNQDLISGPVNFNPDDDIILPGETSSTLNLTSAGTITWTHTWNEVYGSTTLSCSESFSLNNVTPYATPSCGTATLSSDPAQIYNETSFKLNHNIAVNAGSGYIYVGDTYNPAGQYSCVYDGETGPSIGSRTCNIIPAYLENPVPITWTHNWNVVNSGCVYIFNTCNQTFTQTTKVNPGYIKTIDGNTYIKGQLKQPAFNSIDKLSTYVFGSSLSLSNHLNPLVGNCEDSTNPTCSSMGKGFIFKDGYNDANASSDWFGALKSKVLEIDRDDDDINVTQAENLTIPSGTCSGKNIYIVENNLTINPRFTLANEGSSCLFLVGGKTIINNGTDMNNFSTLPYNNTDLVEAFIITNDYEDSDDGDDLLVIKGGLIVNGKNTFYRATGVLDKPSTILHYEGARYIKHYKDFLSLPQQLTIKEVN